MLNLMHKLINAWRGRGGKGLFFLFKVSKKSVSVINFASLAVVLPSLQCTLPFGDKHVKLYLCSHTQSIYFIL